MTKHAEILLIEGPDASAFVQAQFSSDTRSLIVGHWQFSAWLNAKGRVRALFHLAKLADERYCLLLRGGRAADMAEGLQRFVFRLNLSIKSLPSKCINTGPVLAMYATLESGNQWLLGCGTHSMQIDQSTTEDLSWAHLQILLGWPWLPPSTLDELLPTALSLQRLHAVSIDKGCYPGQEIVARLHFRGGHKRHLHSVTSLHALQPGNVLRKNTTEVGQVLDVSIQDEKFDVLVTLDDGIAEDFSNDQPVDLDNGTQLRLLQSWTT